MISIQDLKKLDERKIVTNEPCIRKGESPFIVPFINFYYFWGLVQYYIKKKKLQRILCSLAHCLSIGCATYTIYSSFVELTHENPATLIIVLLELLSYIAQAILIVLIIYMLWRREEKVLEIVNCTRVSYDFIPSQQIKSLKRMVSLVTTLDTLAMSALVFCVFTSEGHYLKKYLNDTANKDSPNPGVENITESEQNASGFATVPLDVISNAVIVGMFTYVAAMYTFMQHFFLVISLTLRQLGKEFEVNLENTFVLLNPITCNEESGIWEGIELYIGIKNVTDTIKKLLGFELLIFCIGSMAYYSKAPHILLGKRGKAAKGSLIFSFQTLISWFIAAEFHQNVKDVLCNWTGRHLRSRDLKTNIRLRLMEITSEASTDPVALQNKYFIVTYSFIFGLLSMIVTYGLIVFQLQQGSDPSLVN